MQRLMYTGRNARQYAYIPCDSTGAAERVRLPFVAGKASATGFVFSA